LFGVLEGECSVGGLTTNNKSGAVALGPIACEAADHDGGTDHDGCAPHDHRPVRTPGNRRVVELR